MSYAETTTTTFWKFREKMRGKDEEKRTAMKDENGRIQEEEEKIKEIYRNHYKNLLQEKQANGIEEKKAEEISKIRTRSRNQLAKDNEIKEITNEEVDKAIKELNNKKVADKHGWKNEMLKNCGNNMKESVKKALNEIGKGKIVEEWKEVQIQSIYKNKGKKDEMKNQRGIFITSNMSKLFEKVIKERNREKLEKKITRFQNGAMKGRGARDNLMILQAIMDYNRQIGNNVYILITDAEKSFDKLWLEDCCNSLYEIGMEVNEIQVIEELNTNIKAKIDTPYGMTEEIKIREAVKQGSVTGPILCIAETDQVNRINERTVSTIGPNIVIESLIFVDDILAAGNKNCIERTGRNLRAMEIQKKFTFSRDKTKIIKVVNKKNSRKKYQQWKWSKAE